MKICKINKNFLIKVINNLIPENQFYNMPKASDAINVLKFYKLLIKKNKKIKNSKKIFKKYIEHYLLEEYYSSKKVNKIINRKCLKFIKNEKSFRSFNLRILDPVLKMKVKYKKYEI